MPAMSPLPALAKETAVMVTAGAMTPVTVSVEMARHGSERRERLAAQLGTVLRELTVTARALQKVALVVAEAVEDGFLDELRAGLRDVAHAVELMAVVSSQLDQAMPVLDATAPSLKVMNTTLAQLNGTIAQLDTFPGVRIARRFVGRPGTADVY
jgi:hypothetical protein